MTVSWRTSVIGVLIILSAVCGVVADLMQGAAVDWNMVVELVMAGLVGLGFLEARDNLVSSAEVRRRLGRGR